MAAGACDWGRWGHRSVAPGGAEPAVPPCRPWQRVHLEEYRSLHPLHHELGYPVASLEPYRGPRIGVEQSHPYLATVPGVHRARSIHDRDAVTRSQAGPRVHERGVAVGQGDRHPGGHDYALPRGQLGVNGGDQVDARIPGVGATRYREVWVEPLDEDLDEVGVNGGHSAFLALSANPELEFHGVDICDHRYVEPAVAWLADEFPGRVFLHPGNSLEVLPRLASSSSRFDLFHIDGAKFNYLDDIANSSRMVSPEGAVVIVDDAETTSATIALSILSRFGVVRSHPEFPPMSPDVPNRHEIRSLLPSTAGRRLLIKSSARAMNGARRLKALWERDSEWADYHPTRREADRT